MLDVFNTFEYYPFSSFEVIMFKTMLIAQDVTNSSFTVEIVWRKMMFFHMMVSIYSCGRKNH